MIKVIKESDNNLIDIVSERIESDGIVCFKSDTVYAFACDARSDVAIRKIYDLKGRELNKPLAVYVKDITMAKEIFAFDRVLEDFCEENLPGFLTIVVEKINSEPYCISKNLNVESNRIGFRIINDNFINQVIGKCKFPLAVTSANFAGEDNIENFDEILEEFSGFDILAVDSGFIESNIASTVLDYESGFFKVIRKGKFKIK